MRNPDWVRDEVILAMDLYFRAGRRQLPATHPDVVELSDALNRLPIHRQVSRRANFRNPNGINMILGNFVRIDPEHGGKGLGRNNHLQEEAWAIFAMDGESLRRTAQAILDAAESFSGARVSAASSPLEEVFFEGEVLTRLHCYRERDPMAVRRKKVQVLAETGKLACETCDFDFREFYGELGDGFAECHHIRPLADLTGVRATRVADLAMVCANCHRMLHRGRNRVTVSDLRALVLKKNQSSE